jgi:DNA-binding CsgD family transcriptional regulator
MPMTSKSTGSAPPSPVLTSAEKDILQMIAEGYRVEDIGRMLALSEPEIERLLAMAEEKLGAMNRLHAVTIAVLNGHIAIGPENPE